MHSCVFIETYLTSNFLVGFCYSPAGILASLRTDAQTQTDNSLADKEAKKVKYKVCSQKVNY